MHGSIERHALRLVEAAYRVADDIEGWIAGVSEASKPLLDPAAACKRTSTGSRARKRARKVVACSRAVETEGTSAMRRLGTRDPSVLADLYFTPPKEKAEPS